MADPVQKFKTLQSQTDFIFAIYYRGHWCPFCMNYVRSLGSLASHIRAANGTPLIISSEAEDHLSTVRSSTGYSGAAIVDPDNLLAKELKIQKVLDVAISTKNGYPHGMAQPAVLVVCKNGKVLESWASIPSMKNFGGAKYRPDLVEIWDNVDAQLQGQQRPYTKYSSVGLTGVLKSAVYN